MWRRAEFLITTRALNAEFSTVEGDRIATVPAQKASEAIKGRMGQVHSGLFNSGNTDLRTRTMARVEGIDPKQTSFLMRQVFRKVRKMLGRDLTPMKISARVPRVFWTSVVPEWLLGQKGKVPPRLRSLILLRTASRVGCPF